jgi:hypothetical protein
MTTTTSRRAILAGIAVSPALAASTLTLAGATAFSLEGSLATADAELLELGRQFEPLIEEWRALRLIDAWRAKEHDAACERAGLHPIELGSVPDDEWREHMDRNAKFGWPEGGDDDDVWNHIHDRMYALHDRILAIQPKTVAGLVVHLRAFSAAESGLWDGAGGDDDKTRKLLDSICAFAGVTPLPLTLPEKVS